MEGFYHTTGINGLSTCYFYIQSFINKVLELNISSLYKLIKAFTANSDWFSPTVGANSCTEGCVVYCGFYIFVLTMISD